MVLWLAPAPFVERGDGRESQPARPTLPSPHATLFFLRFPSQFLHFLLFALSFAVVSIIARLRVASASLPLLPRRPSIGITLDA